MGSINIFKPLFLISLAASSGKIRNVAPDTLLRTGHTTEVVCPVQVRYREREKKKAQ